MAEVTFDVTPATPQKRTHDDCIVVNTDSTANTYTKSSSTEQQSTSTRASPAPSSASSLTDLTPSNSNDTPSSAVKASSTAAPPAKKRKLGYIEREAEKAAKAREKEEKARVKAEEKARKDEEKRKVAEEKENAKRAKEIEKAQKQAVLDAERREREEKKAAKEAEKKEKDAQKEAERLKKERSQMRLGVFFGKPKPESTPPSTPEDVSDGASSRRSSIASIDMERPVLERKDTICSANPDYEKWILPFYVPEYTDVAPYNRFKLSRQHDFEVTAGSQATVCGMTEHLGRPRKRMKRTVPVKEIISNIQASGLDVVELDSMALDVLGRTSYKYLHFREDVRPPYQGTFTRFVSPRTSRKISRNPFTRGLPDKNYDYDSEAEWEPPGEDDEELNDDDEMSVADDAEDEMADFLDDEDDTARRKGPLTDMEPISSGLCWVGEAFDDKGANMKQYRMDFLHDSTTFPIDPFSTKHWTDETKPKTAVKADPNAKTMSAPRLPLHPLSPNFVTGMKQDIGIDGKPSPLSTQKKATSTKPLKMVEPEYMEDFKKAIEGSDLTKAGLIEILKKQFPKCSKDAIKDTLGAVAKREGKKEADKKWCLLEVEQGK
ncbi:hypothetical protein PMZ80_006194 [Knufia obscura]|uniref:Chromatin assembly factor 1 subunit A n=1 Tax=Knufia obscura TaxID=1635080 RepID=A0ABR0RJX6_9EURO|nr:hypothetical protein PMZ80_006194 [Knufia obscura]